MSLISLVLVVDHRLQHAFCRSSGLWDTFVQAIWGLLHIFFGGQAIIFMALVLWTIWMDAIRPRLIPADNIARAADDIVASCPLQVAVPSEVARKAARCQMAL